MSYKVKVHKTTIRVGKLKFRLIPETVERPDLAAAGDLRAALNGASQKLYGSSKLTNTQKRHIGDTVYVIAYTLKHDDDLWQAFCEFPEWQGKSRKPLFAPASRENALYFVRRFVAGWDKATSAAHVTWLGRLLGAAWEADDEPRNIVSRIWKIQESSRQAAASQREKQNLRKLNFKFAPNEFVIALNQKLGKYRIIIDVLIDADSGQRTRGATIMGIEPYKKQGIAAVKRVR